MTIKEVPKLYRIHIGGISTELAHSIEDLEKRINKIGHVVEPLELHEKPTLDYHFAYITMHLKKSEFLQLKKMFDGTRFKGSKLSIQLAKEDYLMRWKKDCRRQDIKMADRKLRHLTALKRLERISQRDTNPFILSQVRQGRMRESPRKCDLKTLTIRVNIKGRLKVIKCLKSKLWGYDKNRKIRDLTYRFVAGEWRDGNDHVVDRFAGKVIVFDDTKISVEDSLIGNDKTEIDKELEEEQAKTNSLLSKMLDQYNFDKPIDIDDIKSEHENSENDPDFDYELTHKDNADMDSEVLTMDYDKIPQTFCIKPSPQELKVAYFNTESNEEIQKIQQKPQIKQNYDEDEDEDGDQFYKNLRPQPVDNYETPNTAESISHNNSDQKGYTDLEVNQQSEQSTNIIEANEEVHSEYSEEEEFIPSFGKSDTGATNDSGNTTEKLRSLLSVPSNAQTVSIIDSAMENNFVFAPVLKSLKSVGLFFSHFNSPFLVAQTQISKLKEIKFNDELKYDEWFWENRGELNREFRKLRRDALRRTKKKLKSSLI